MPRKILLTVLVVLLAGASIVSAHQPVCEFADLTATAPWEVPDPTISYAYFGNVYPPQDIDYFTFDAAAGQSILLSMSIPATDRDDPDIYLPSLAVMGPGLPRDLPAELPNTLLLPEGHGALMAPLGDEPSWFFEPFGRVHFWNWDDYFFEAPQDAAYTVVLWHPEAEIGRYTFVIGQKEVFGGDLECFFTFATYWTPILEGSNPYRDTPMDMLLHDPSQVINVEAEDAPTVELSVFPAARRQLQPAIADHQLYLHAAEYRQGARARRGACAPLCGRNQDRAALRRVAACAHPAAGRQNLKGRALR